MDHGEQTNYVKRVVLPSGKTIEVVLFKDGEPGQAEPDAPREPVVEPHQALHVCVECDSELVYPLRWDEAGPENWTVLLHCPNCDVHREGVFSQQTVEEFDEQLDKGSDALTRAYRRLLRTNMTEEIGRFVGALQAGAILPEDF